MSSQPLIVIEGLYYHYDEETPALNGVDLRISDGAYLAIIGQNGSGKTTLAKHLNALLKPTRGRVLVDGLDTRSTTVARLARTVGYVFQNPDHQIFCPTVREEVGYGVRNLGLGPALSTQRIDEALALFGLQAHADLPPALLGFGLRRVVTVASVYAMRPRVFVLDEPTSGLDARSASELLQRLEALHHAGHTVLLVTHDMEIVAAHAPETLVMHEGRVLAQGPTRAIFSDANHLARAAITPPQVSRLAHRLTDLGLEAGVLTVNDFCRSYRRAVGEV
jgi:energy-coupling factor transporter ATP-binding protein EcfA2